jgi:nickel-dependent lactate racemase
MLPRVRGPSRPSRLSRAELARLVDEALATSVRPGERVLCLVPDSTRTMDLPFFFRCIARGLREIASGLDFMVALGTHSPLDRPAMDRLFGLGPGELESAFPGIRLLNHEWRASDALARVGVLPASEMAELSGGRLSIDLPVTIDAAALDYDRLLVCGPVFPHEVAGFSGGNKYFFPGISGPEVINATHWLGALVGTNAIIGLADTPVRRAIDRAASLIPVARSAICVVDDEEGVFGLFAGEVEKAWASAAALAARTHVAYLEKPVPRVLSVLPEMYDELWVGAKGMYKLDPVVADGGEIVIYAPRLAELSRMHGAFIRELGYHVLEYFTSRWERFSSYPWGVMAHSTHVRGRGTYDAASGIERPRIRVTLSTALPESLCREIGLGYLDPASPEIARLLAGDDPDTFVVRRAGETLYRLESAGTTR